MKRILGVVAALVFLIGYFLPFMSYRGLNVTLFDILKAAWENFYIKLDIIAFSLAFLLAVIGLIMTAVNKGTRTRGLMIAGVIGLIACGLEALTGNAQLEETSLNASVFEILGAGFYVLVAASIGMIIAHSLKEKPPLNQPMM